VNLTGTFLLSQAAVPALVMSSGCIVNMASVAGLRATPYNAAYCASKGGVVMLTKSMAIELAKDGVRVNAVCPASVDTPFLRNFELPEGADLSLFARAASPMGRRVEPDEVAGGVAYLASDDARTVSGTTLVIDGAATA
jgi:NAD(P)-dependent dehydrogenase (short-subunit alcohol dehydrogenase family)